MKNKKNFLYGIIIIATLLFVIFGEGTPLSYVYGGDTEAYYLNFHHHVIQIDDWWKKNKCAELSYKFKLAGVPCDRAGNQITSKVYRLLYGIQIRDTQTRTSGDSQRTGGGVSADSGRTF
ncbi:MAG: hypothetical protein V8R94_03405 [Lachnospiraceae bacterium]